MILSLWQSQEKKQFKKWKKRFPDAMEKMWNEKNGSYIRTGIWQDSRSWGRFPILSTRTGIPVLVNKNRNSRSCQQDRESCWQEWGLIKLRIDKKIYCYIRYGKHTRMLWTDSVDNHTIHWNKLSIYIIVIISRGKNPGYRTGNRNQNYTIGCYTSFHSSTVCPQNNMTLYIAVKHGNSNDNCNQINYPVNWKLAINEQ